MGCMRKDPARPPRLRGRVAALAGLAAAALLAALAVVVPQADRRGVAVARFGSTVRLLRPGLDLSLPFVEGRKRLAVDAEGVVLDIPVDMPLASGAVLPGTLEVRLAGHGRLPVDASSIRRLGWEQAWRQWLGPLPIDEVGARRVLAATPLWRSSFPDDPEVAAADLATQLASRFAPLRLVAARVTARGGDDLVRAAATAELRRRAPCRGRLVVLGLDALDWKLVDELAGRGQMPTMAALLRRSAHAVLEVSRPLISPVVWTTIATGVSPEVHGVLDFLEPDPAGGPPRPVTSASRKATALWEMFGAAGRRTATIGWWATFPAAAPPAGRVYSDRLTEQLLGLSAVVPRLADPPEAEELAHRLAVKAADVTPDMVAPLVRLAEEELAQVRRAGGNWDDPVVGLAKLVAATLTIERLTDAELARGSDVVLAYLEGTDTVGHLFAPMMPPPLPGVDPAQARRFGGVVERYFALVDAWLGRIVKSLGPADRLVIVSDHGFTWGERRPRVPSGAHTATAVMWHDPEGAFLAFGRGIAPTPQRQRLRVLDVAPALLALGGLPPAAEMPGAVPRWLVVDAPEGRVSYSALIPPLTSPVGDLPPEARAEEIAKLRALGYLAGPASPTPPAPASTAPAVPVPQFDRAEARRLNNLGSSRGEAGDPRGAEEAFRQAINADPTYAPSHYNLALLLRKQGRFDEADREFWLAVETGVRDREMAVVQSALDYASRGELARARATFAEGRRRFPDSAVIWLNAGVFLGEQGELEEARRCLERAVQLAPTNPRAHSNLAAALWQQGELAGARRHLETAVQLDPGNVELRRQLAALERATPP